MPWTAAASRPAIVASDQAPPRFSNAFYHGTCLAPQGASSPTSLSEFRRRDNSASNAQQRYAPVEPATGPVWLIVRVVLSSVVAIVTS